MKYRTINDNGSHCREKGHDRIHLDLTLFLLSNQAAHKILANYSMVIGCETTTGIILQIAI